MSTVKFVLKEGLYVLIGLMICAIFLRLATMLGLVDITIEKFLKTSAVIGYCIFLLVLVVIGEIKRRFL